MLDMDRILEAFLDHVRARFKDDIALVFTCGSRLRGEQHPKSDLDVVFINDTPRGAEASIQFLVDDIGFDFYPWSWERAERVAAFNQPILANLLESEVVYVRSEQDRERFTAIRDKARRLLSPEGRPELLAKAADQFKECCVSLYSMRVAASANDLTSVKTEANKLIGDIVFVVLMMNQAYSRRGWTKDREFLEQLPIAPEGFLDLVDDLVANTDCAQTLKTGELLADRTRALLVDETERVAQPQGYDAVFPGVYEEFKSIVNKVCRACDMGDQRTAFAACLSNQDEFARFLEAARKGTDCNRLFTFRECRETYDAVGLPDFSNAVSRFDPDRVRDAIRSLDMGLRAHLESNGIAMNVFEDEAAFERFLQTR